MDMLGLLIQGAVGVQFRLGYSDRGDLQKGGVYGYDAGAVG